MPDSPLAPELPPMKYSGSADLVLGDALWHCHLARYQIHRDPISQLLMWEGEIWIDKLLPEDQNTYRIVFDNGATGEIQLNGILTTGHMQSVPIRGLGDLVMLPPKRRPRRSKPRSLG